MSLCVVVLRHVNNEVTNRMWIESCTNARKHYPEATLVLIDDNSDEAHVSVTASEMLAMANGDGPFCDFTQTLPCDDYPGYARTSAGLLY